MNFRDVGIIIAKRTLQEHSSIITIFTQHHGLYSGVIRELSKKMGSIHQEGNIVDFFWSARLHEHIGTARCELIKSYNSSLITNREKLYAFNSIISLIKLAFHEREPHNNFFSTFNNYLNELANNFVFETYIKLELEILAEAGYRLELDNCTVTGAIENLIYVSPKSGKAVSLEAGLPFADKLLSLPRFLTMHSSEANHIEKKQAFALTTYFFNRYLFSNNTEPQARIKFIEYLCKD